MESTGGGERAESEALLAKLAQISARVEYMLRPEEDPDVLHADGTGEAIRFVLVRGTPDTEQTPDNPMIGEGWADPADFEESMINIANYTLQELFDAWRSSPEMRQAIIGDEVAAPSFDAITARLNSYFFGDTLDESRQMMEIHSLAMTGGNMDGMTLNKILFRTPTMQMHLHIVMRGNTPRISWIGREGQHPIVAECRELFGPTKELTDLVDGRFEEEHLDAILSDIAQHSQGLLPADHVNALLARVRDVAIEAKARTALRFLQPTLSEVDDFLGILA